MKNADRQRQLKNLRRFALTLAGTVLIAWLLLLVVKNESVCFLVVLLLLTLNVPYFTSRCWQLGTAFFCALFTWLLCRVVLLSSSSLNTISLLVLLGSTCGIAWITGLMTQRIQDQKNRTMAQCSRTEMLNRINNRLLTERGMSALHTLLLSCVYEVCSRPSVLFETKGEEMQLSCKLPQGLLTYPSEHQAASEAFKGACPTGVGTGLCQYTAFRYFPLITHEKVFAVLGVMFDTEKPVDQELIKTLEQIAVRAAVTIERQRLADEQQQIMMETEAERIRSNFLRAISHDLRTPLTGIIGACSALNGREVQLSETARQDLIRDISEEASWLLRMVENLLSVTRVGRDAPKLKKSLEPVEEVVAEALDKSRKRFPNIVFHVNLPEEFLMVPMDPTLIVQVLTNLIENAAKYSGNNSVIDLLVADHRDAVAFSVRDHGKGLSKSDLSTLFTPSAAKNGDSGHGLGLGLSICRSVIRVHGGEITGENCQDGGAVFTFVLPKEETDEK